MLTNRSHKLSGTELMQLLVKVKPSQHATDTVRIIDERLGDRLLLDDPSLMDTLSDEALHYNVLHTLVNVLDKHTTLHTLPNILHVLRRSADHFDQDSRPALLTHILSKWCILKIAKEAFPVHKVMQMVMRHVMYTADVRTGRIQQYPEDGHVLLEPSTIAQLLHVQAKINDPTHLHVLCKCLQGQVDKLKPKRVLGLLNVLAAFGQMPAPLHLNDILKALQPSLGRAWLDPCQVISKAAIIIKAVEPVHHLIMIRPFVQVAIEAIPHTPHPEHIIKSIAYLRRTADIVFESDELAKAYAQAALRLMPGLLDNHVVVVAMLLGSYRKLGEEFDLQPLLDRLVAVAEAAQGSHHMLTVLLPMCRIVALAANGPYLDDMEPYYQALWGLLHRFSEHMVEGKVPPNHLNTAQTILKTLMYCQLAPPHEDAAALLNTVLSRAGSDDVRIAWQLYGLAAKLRIALCVDMTASVLRTMLQGGHPASGEAAVVAERVDVQTHDMHSSDGDVGMQHTDGSVTAPTPTRDYTAADVAARRAYQIVNLVVSVVATYAHDAQALETLLPLLQKCIEGLQDSVTSRKLRNEMRCAHAVVLGRTRCPLLDEAWLQVLNTKEGKDEDEWKHLFCSRLDLNNTIAAAATTLYGEEAVSQHAGDQRMPVDALVTMSDGRQVAVLYVPQKGYEAVNKPKTLLRGPAVAMALLEALGVPAVAVYEREWATLDTEGRVEFLQAALEGA